MVDVGSLSPGFDPRGELVSLLTNLGAMQARQSLDEIGRESAALRNRVATGLRVAGPKDDGATWSIAQNMRSELGGWRVTRDSMARTSSILDVTLAAGEGISDTLAEMREKALGYADTSLDVASRAVTLTDLKSMAAHIDNAARNASFDGLNLLTARPGVVQDFTPASHTPQASLSLSVNPAGEAGNLAIQVSVPPSAAGGSLTLSGALAGGGAINTAISFPPSSKASNHWLSFDYGDPDSANLTGPTSLNLDFLITPSAPPAQQGFVVNSATFTPFQTAEVSLGSPGGDSIRLMHRPMTIDALGLDNLDQLTPDQVLSAVDGAAGRVHSLLARFGAQSQLIARQMSQAGRLIDTLEAGIGNIVDADMARDSAKLQALQVRENLATQSLGIASREAGWMLNLFRAA